MPMLYENDLFCGWQPESFRAAGGEDPRFDVKSIALSCCRNDWAGASIAIRYTAPTILLMENRTDFTPVPNRFPGNPAITVRPQVICPGLSVNLYRAGMVLDDNQVYKADPLFDSGTSRAPSWRVLQLFLEVKVPAGTAPGIYSGEVRIYLHRMYDDEILAETLPFTVEVADVTLPAGPDRKFHLTIWHHPTNLARHYDVPLFSDRHFELLENYIRSLSEMGSVVSSVVVADIPWAGQFCYNKRDPLSDLFEYSLVRIRRDASGIFHYDFSILDRYLRLCKKYDMTREIYLFGLIRNWIDEEAGYGNITEDYPDAIRLRYVDEADGAGKFMRKAENIKAYIAALYAWLKENGWAEFCVISADEPPDMDAYSRSLAILREVAPDLKTQLDIPPSIINQRPELHFDTYTPGIDGIFFSEKEERGATKKAVARCTGKVSWSTCCWPLTPNNFLRSPLLEGRICGLLAEWLKMDGFLRWAFNCWPVDPYQGLDTMDWPYGDAFFVYPGKDGRPVPSLRYFALKRGAGDYELMQMVKDARPDGEAIVDDALNLIFREPDVTCWNICEVSDAQFSYNPADYEEVRRRLVAALTETAR